MAKQVKKTKKAAKVKKKIWVQVVAPKLFNEKIVAETPVTEISSVVGKIVHSNLMTLTGNMRAQSINTKLLITEVKDGKAYSKLIRYEITPPAIKRFVRRKRDRIDESLVYKTKDGIKVRLKPFILTSFPAKGSVLTELRRRIKILLYKVLSQTTYDNLVGAIINNNLQKDLKQSLSKFHPVRNVDIRVMHIEKDTAKITPAPMIRESQKPQKEEEGFSKSREIPKEEKKEEALQQPAQLTAEAPQEETPKEESVEEKPAEPAKEENTAEEKNDASVKKE